MIDYTGPQWDTAALLVIDLQRDFLDDGVAPIPGTSAVVPAVATLAAAFRAARRPIAHIVRLYEPGGSDVDLPRRGAIEAGARIAAPGTDGAEIAAGVAPPATQLDAATLLAGGVQPVGEREVVVFKPRWSAFHRTGLANWLAQHDCDTVVVAGCNLPNCPRATLFDGSERDLRTVLVTDAVSQTSPERLADLAGIGVSLRTAVEVTRALAGTVPPGAGPGVQIAGG
ncbi:isochorismatase family cysteine hydrolase [Mycobacterium sp. 1274756.6]|uniref:cysteine hydrolase family protein n=1 Tax=Mycobacterium sp. 1274756.6 TaxID=1834076 RepID=UPI0007FEFFE9|nr:isochorismatase family cysteine hydrolase [Mycobacterium sp. 1274756.6]OBJ67874.1 cysteine hydrolase [Mycobacterium sp. 1274756.6]